MLCLVVMLQNEFGDQHMTTAHDGHECKHLSCVGVWSWREGSSVVTYISQSAMLEDTCGSTAWSPAAMSLLISHGLNLFMVLL